MARSARAASSGSRRRRASIRPVPRRDLDKNHTHALAVEAEHLAVHFLDETAKPLAELFGGETSDEIDKFSRCAWHEGPHGLPLLDDCPNRFVGRVVEKAPLGDHLAMLLEPVAAEHGSDAPQLTFHAARDIEPGHAP